MSDEPPGSSKLRSAWTLRPGRLPSERAMLRDPRLRGMESNAIFWFLMRGHGGDSTGLRHLNARLRALMRAMPEEIRAAPLGPDDLALGLWGASLSEPVERAEAEKDWLAMMGLVFLWLGVAVCALASSRGGWLFFLPWDAILAWHAFRRARARASHPVGALLECLRLDSVRGWGLESRKRSAATPADREAAALAHFGEHVAGPVAEFALWIGLAFAASQIARIRPDDPFVAVAAYTAPLAIAAACGWAVGASLRRDAPRRYDELKAAAAMALLPPD